MAGFSVDMQCVFMAQQEWPGIGEEKENRADYKWEFEKKYH